MNILIVSSYYYPELGAASNRIQLMAEHLTKEGCKVEVLCPLPNYPSGKIFEKYRNKLIISEYINNIKIFRHFIYPSNSSNSFLRILSMLSFALSLWLFAFRINLIKQKDLIIIQNSPLLVSFSANILFKLIYRKKTVLNVSDLWPLSGLELGVFKKGFFYNFLEMVERRNYVLSDAFMGQSNEILNFLENFNDKPKFLYRNVPVNNNFSNSKKKKKFKIIYAGLLGVAQEVFSIIKNVNFKKLGVEFHIYGDGAQKKSIKNYLLKNPKSNVYFHGSISKRELMKILPDFHASLIPLKSKIYGAVPSKIFEVISHGVPVIFSGDGEGAKIINDFSLGYCNTSGDYNLLSHNISLLVNLEANDYNTIKKNCIEVSKKEFNFKKQILSLKSFLLKL